MDNNIHLPDSPLFKVYEKGVRECHLARLLISDIPMESLCKAFGMTREEYFDTLIKSYSRVTEEISAALLDIGIPAETVSRALGIPEKVCQEFISH